MAESIVGIKVRVHDKITPECPGTVMIPIRGGIESYSAITNDVETIERGAFVTILEEPIGRTVIVERAKKLGEQ